jgi:hypothetical protein
MVYFLSGRDEDFRRGDDPSNGPALAQEPPATTPAPETEQAPAAKTDTATETKKPEPAAHPHTVHHTQVGRYVWPWDWAWYQLRRELRYLQHHRA